MAAWYDNQDDDADASAVRIETRQNGRYARPVRLATVLTIEESQRLESGTAAQLVEAGLDLVRAHTVDQAVRVLRATTPDAIAIVVGGQADGDADLRPGIDVLAQLPPDWSVPIATIVDGRLSVSERRVGRRLAAMVVGAAALRHARYRSRLVRHLLRTVMALTA